MPRWLNILLQVSAVIGHGVNLSFVPPKYQSQTMAGIAVFQAVVGIIAHSYNPDGTSASVAYTPPSGAPASITK